MSYILDSTTIRRPITMNESNSTQIAEVRALDGSISRDLFGSNKRTWTLEYRNTKKSDYDTIKSIHTSYLDTGNTKTWEISETNYTVSETSVHVDLLVRGFEVGGADYISDFVLVLTEA